MRMIVKQIKRYGKGLENLDTFKNQPCKKDRCGSVAILLHMWNMRKMLSLADVLGYDFTAGCRKSNRLPIPLWVISAWKRDWFKRKTCMTNRKQFIWADKVTLLAGQLASPAIFGTTEQDNGIKPLELILSTMHWNTSIAINERIKKAPLKAIWL